MKALLVSLIFGALGFGAAPARADEVQDFAIRVLEAIQARSVEQNREFCGLIGYNRDGVLATTKVRRGRKNRCNPGRDPRGWTIVASYHSHGAYSINADAEVPSTTDLDADIIEGMDGYIGTPGGRVWYNSALDGISVQLCGPGCITPDPAYTPCLAYLPELSYTLDELFFRVENDPGIC